MLHNFCLELLDFSIFLPILANKLKGRDDSSMLFRLLHFLKKTDAELSHPFNFPNRRHGFYEIASNLSVSANEDMSSFIAYDEMRNALNYMHKANSITQLTEYVLCTVAPHRLQGALPVFHQTR